MNPNTYQSPIVKDSSEIKEILKDPKQGDIIAIGEYEYRYTNMGGHWQQQNKGVKWFDTYYNAGEKFTTEKLRSELEAPELNSKVADNISQTQEAVAKVMKISRLSRKDLGIKIGNIEPGKGDIIAHGNDRYIVHKYPDGKISVSITTQRTPDIGEYYEVEKAVDHILGQQHDPLWQNIVSQTQQSARDGTGQSMTPAEQKNIEETIEKMLAERRRTKHTENTDTKNKPLLLTYDEPTDTTSTAEDGPIQMTDSPEDQQGSLEDDDSIDVPQGTLSGDLPQGIFEGTPDTTSDEVGDTIENAEDIDENPKPQIEGVPEVDEPREIRYITPSEVYQMSANISEVQDNLMDVARSRAAERLRSEQKTINIFRKMGRFFTRNSLLEQYTQEELRALRGEGIFDADTQNIRSHASDRFGRTSQIDADSIEQIGENIQRDDINDLADKYIRFGMSDDNFQNEFQKIIGGDYFGEKLIDINQQGTNILIQVRRQRAFVQFIKSINDDTDIATHLDKFLEDHHPYGRSILESRMGMNLDTNKNDIISHLANEKYRKQLYDQFVEVDLQILTGGKAAYAIDASDKQDDRVYRTGKWLQRHPVISSIATGLGITAASIAGGPLGNLFFGSAAIGATTGARRSADYTDEHSDFEKRITQGTHKDAEIYQTITRLEKELSDATGLSKWWTNWRLDRAKNKLKLYERQGIDLSNISDSEQETREGLSEAKNIKKLSEKDIREGTTHRHFLLIGGLNDRLENYLKENKNFEFKGQEKRTKYFRQWILQGLARLDAWKDTGHNFLKSKNIADMEVDYSKNIADMEADYNRLYENIILGSERLNISLEELRADEDYEKIMTKLKNDYTRADGSFDAMRTGQVLKKGATHASVYAVSNLLFQWLAGSGLFDTSRTIAGKTVTTSGGVAVDPDIAHQLEATLGTTKYGEFITELSDSNYSDTLWETLTKNIFQNDSIGNSTKNEIMTFILNATDAHNGVDKPALLVEAIKQGLMDDITGNSSRIDTILSYLKRWGYGNVNKTWLVNTIQDIDAGISINTLSPTEQTKVAEALWCYVHRGAGLQGPMWEVFMDRLPDIVTQESDKTVVTKGAQWLRYLGVPTWSNTFLSPLKKPSPKKDATENTDDPEQPIAPQANESANQDATNNTSHARIEPDTYASQTKENTSIEDSDPAAELTDNAKNYIQKIKNISTEGLERSLKGVKQEIKRQEMNYLNMYIIDSSSQTDNAKEIEAQIQRKETILFNLHRVKGAIKSELQKRSSQK